MTAALIVAGATVLTAYWVLTQLRAGPRDPLARGRRRSERRMARDLAAGPRQLAHLPHARPVSQLAAPADTQPDDAEPVDMALVMIRQDFETAREVGQRYAANLRRRVEHAMLTARTVEALLSS